MLGELLLQQGRAADAVAPLEKAAALEPSAYDAQHNLALAYVGIGRANDAIPEINKSITSQQTRDQNAWWGSLFVRSISEAAATEYPLAKADLQRVVAAKPDLAEAKQALALIPDPHAAAAAKPQIPIPYAKLVMQSEYWPLYP
jgi:predicted Zn-dependent protease